MELFTEEWKNAIIEKLRADAQFQKVAKRFGKARFHFNILKDPKGGLRADVGIGVELPAVDNSWWGVKGLDEVDFCLEGPAGTMKEIIEGKASALGAITGGRLKLKKGDVSKLTDNLGLVTRFVEILQSVR